MVSWYSGPGWIGWAPLGALGAAGQNIVTTVPGGLIQNGLMVSPQNVTHMPLTAGTRIRNLPFQPSAGAMLSGTPLSTSAETAFTPSAGTAHKLAPASVLMGVDGATEQSLKGSAHQPLRMRMGATLGGHYSVGGTLGEFRGNAFLGATRAAGPKGAQEPSFSHGPGAGGPVFLPHGQQAAMSHPSGGGGMTPSGPPAGGNASTPPPSTGAASAAHNTSSGSGHH
jgi:hypothetical protein